MALLGFIWRLAVRPVPHYERWGLYSQALIVLACLIWFQMWPPIPTVAIGFLGVVAVIMAVRADHFTHGERVVWILISFALFIVEMRAIYKDRDEHDKVQAELRIREDAARKAESDSFQSLLTAGKKLFIQQDALSRETVGQVTGGDSYAIVVPILIAAESDSFHLAVSIGKNCKRRAIPNAQIMLQESNPNFGTEADLLKMMSGNSGDMLIFNDTVPPYWIPITSSKITPSVTGVTTYYVHVLGRNKPTTETLQVRKNQQTGRWETSFKVVREVTPSTRTRKGKYKTLEVEKWSTTEFIESQ